MKEIIDFKASIIAPNPKETNYWIDLKEDPTGAVIKVYDGSEWKPISGDSKEIEQMQQLINSKADKTDTYTRAQIDAKVASVYRVKGSVASFSALPKTSVVGDVYNCDDSGANYVCTKSSPAEWDKLSENVDLSNCVASDEVRTITYMTQSEYDNLNVKDTQTLYLIHD